MLRAGKIHTTASLQVVPVVSEHNGTYEASFEVTGGPCAMQMVLDPLPHSESASLGAATLWAVVQVPRPGHLPLPFLSIHDRGICSTASMWRRYKLAHCDLLCLSSNDRGDTYWEDVQGMPSQ